MEYAIPADVTGSSQDRGNGGVIFMGRYEIQILDSYNNRTYADGMMAAIYGEWPPLVNASRKPGEWQSLDIVFEAPRFTGGSHQGISQSSGTASSYTTAQSYTAPRHRQ